MSCCSGNFSSRDQTWSKQSDLRPTKWEPFPELSTRDNYIGPPEFFTSECAGFNSMNNAYSSKYNLGPHANMRVVNEGYTSKVGNSTPYLGLGRTWNSQKPYSL